MAVMKRGIISAYVFSLVIVATIWGCNAFAGGLLWFDGGRPKSEAWQAAAILSAAAQDGLDPVRYRGPELQHVLTVVEKTSGVTGAEMAQVDQALTQAMKRYLHDLHYGQIDPRQIQENFSFRKKSDIEALLRAAVREGRLPEAVASAAPTSRRYVDLRLALAKYRGIAADPAVRTLWKYSLPPLPDKKLELGQFYEGVALMVQRLVVLGDLPYGAPIPTLYEGDVVDGIKAFQLRHGLAPDGVIGWRTLEQLNVRPAARVRQIELAMERLRWTPLLDAPRMIAVNVPEHMLEAYEVRDGDIDVKVTMRVIIGKAEENATPLFDEDMRFVEFSPFWNVPLSIAQTEVIPKLFSDPGYFDEQGFEFVTNDGQVLTALSLQSLDAVLLGQMRIRQRPGPKNPLGDIKFAFPNKDSIYLHHTSSPRLFTRNRRDMSHGCVRVEEPVSLAKFVLQNYPDWGEDRIREAMEKGVSAKLRLREPVRVVIAYNTVSVKNDGVVYFYNDIYGQDKLLSDAIRQSAQDSRSMSQIAQMKAQNEKSF